MIHIFEGRPGGGKSYRAVERMAEDLARGSIVHTNVFVYPEKILKYVYDVYGVEVPASSLVYYENGSELAFNMHKVIPKGTREVTNKGYLDEAHLWLNSRDWKRTHDMLRPALEYLTQHRKLFHDWVFITQDSANIDAQMRRLAQGFFRYRDLAKMSAPGLGKVYPFQHILEIAVDYDGKFVMGRKIIPRRKRIFDLYESEQLLSSTEFSKDVRSSAIKSNRGQKVKIAVGKFLSAVVVIQVLFFVVYFICNL